MDAFAAEQRALSEQWSDINRRAIVEMCKAKGIPLASHDDATKAHVDESHELGLVLAEFPTTVEAAKRSHELGLKVMMGAPNIVRGGSHSGNVAAHELASLAFWMRCLRTTSPGACWMLYSKWPPMNAMRLRWRRR